MGNWQNILHDSLEVVAYRHTYIERRLDNLNSNGLSKRTEIFLDESYCHLDHHAKKTWFVPDEEAVKESGRKPMLVIFGAIAVRKVDNCLRAEIVEDNILIWPVKGEWHLQALPSTGDKRKRGRPGTKNTAQQWASLPQCVKNSNITPDYHDYHGNFNADLFEKLFDRLCDKLKEKYSGCDIHMDGAKYHFRKINPLPTGQANVSVIKEWYDDNRVALPAPNARNCVTKAMMLEKLKAIRSEYPPIYARHNIANKYGHRIMKTPPYHCELQPIEGVWGIAKQQVAYSPDLENSEVQLAHRLYTLFSEIKQNSLLSLWKQTVERCQKYSTD